MAKQTLIKRHFKATQQHRQHIITHASKPLSKSFPFPIAALIKGNLLSSFTPRKRKSPSAFCWFMFSLINALPSQCERAT
ncbi:hypothetical protein IW01_05380 [Pectobacterium brasiliense]|nr:hypothetical protein IW01_05380 [Pectobacterium brasiliense]